MPNRIFISYNHNDKQLIDTIARRLELEFGMNNIFYDAWTIQPGDSIIGKMNEGLGDFTTFFFFVSPNSLQSKMVTLEWQTALNRAINEQLKFVAVRIAECMIPSILTDKTYIDLYGEGLDDAVEKMKLIIRGESCYKPLKDIENIDAEYEIINEKTVMLTIRSRFYAEQNPIFAFVYDEETGDNDFDIYPKSESMYYNEEPCKFSDYPCSGSSSICYAGVDRSLKKGFPLVVDINFTKEGYCMDKLFLFVLEDKEIGQYRRIVIHKKRGERR